MSGGLFFFLLPLPLYHHISSHPTMVWKSKSWRSRGGIDKFVCPNEFIFKVVPPWVHLWVFLLLTLCWFLSWNQPKTFPNNLLLIIRLVNTLAIDVYLYCLWVVLPPYGFRWQPVTCRGKNSEDLQGQGCDECGVSFCACCYIRIRVTVTSHQLRHCWWSAMYGRDVWK